MLKGKYWGVEWTAFKRMSDNWQLSASVTYSKTYGNIGGGWGTWKAQGGVLTNPNNLVNLWGRTNFDRPLIVKLMGTIILPYRINLSGYFVHMDGTPTNRTLTVYFPSTVGGVAPKSPNVTVNAEAPGTIRNPTSDLLNLRLEKEFKLGFGVLGFYVDAFNILGFNRLTVNQNNGGYLYADGTFSPFTTYGQINTAEGVRSFLLTMRYHF